MPHGAGMLAAQHFGAAELVDPRATAGGSIAEAFASHPHIGPVLPALGYRPEQLAELQRTILESGADLLVDASPARVSNTLAFPIPRVQVSYRFEQLSGTPLPALIDGFLARN